MSTYIIGDLQGCFEPLERLLTSIQFSPRKDTLVFCGDIVNRGPESLACLQFVHHYSDCAHMVLGNHDLALLCMAEKLIHPGPSDTMVQVLSADEAPLLLSWLLQRPFVHYDKAQNFIVTHAGIWPLWNLSDCLKANDFMKQALAGDQWRAVLANLYGDKPTNDMVTLPFLERCRFIANAFTRMRYCDAKAGLNFSFKGHPRVAPAGIVPWYEHPKRQTIQPMIMFGHWASLKGKCNIANIQALDTGCVWGGELTAFRIEDKQRFSVPSSFISKEVDA